MRVRVVGGLRIAVPQTMSSRAAGYRPPSSAAGAGWHILVLCLRDPTGRSGPRVERSHAMRS